MNAFPCCTTASFHRMGWQKWQNIIGTCTFKLVTTPLLLAHVYVFVCACLSVLCCGRQCALPTEARRMGERLLCINIYRLLWRKIAFEYKTWQRNGCWYGGTGGKGQTAHTHTRNTCVRLLAGLRRGPEKATTCYGTHHSGS